MDKTDRSYVNESKKKFGHLEKFVKKAREESLENLYLIYIRLLVEYGGII